MALNLYAVDSWISGYDIIMEVIFAVITCMVAVVAYHAYKLTEKHQAGLFSGGFFLISASFFIQSIFNFLIVKELVSTVCNAIRMKNILFFNMLGLYSHAILLTTGLAILASMTFRTKNKKPLILLILISFATIMMSQKPLVMSFVLSTLYLLFIVHFYYEHYKHSKVTKKAVILIAFILLLISSFEFLLVAHHALFYPLGHITELAAYLLILFSLYSVRQK